MMTSGLETMTPGATAAAQVDWPQMGRAWTARTTSTTSQGREELRL